MDFDSNIHVNSWLKPLSFFYGLGVELRNKLFDWEVLKSKSYPMPIICVGNLTVGGTGKTPHVEYLIHLLQQHGYHVATLSRGYKRKSKGYILAENYMPHQVIGDEAYQIKQKFPDVRVAVDEDRCRGIEQLMLLDNPRVDVILLDDAFQHRYVKAGLNILLTDYGRLFSADCLLPAGRLREPAKARERAQVVITTKCPTDMKPIGYNIVQKQLDLFPFQKLYYSTFGYRKGLYPLFPTEGSRRLQFPLQQEVLLLCGIAQPQPLIQEIGESCPRVFTLTYPDHYDYQAADLDNIEQKFYQLTKDNRLIITTEKDAARLVNMPVGETLRPYIYVLPTEVEFLLNQEEQFNKTILDYVSKNTRNN